MENASKALIIAGAILITIVVISLAVLVFNNFGGSAKRMANMDEQEISSFNSKITPYIGKSVSGSQVRALVQVIRSIDQNSLNTKDAIKRVSMYLGSGTSQPIVQINGEKVEVNAQLIETNQFYTVKSTYNSNGLITTVNATKN